MNLRVLDAADDLIGDLAKNADDALAALDAQLARIAIERAAIARFLAELKPGTDVTAPPDLAGPSPAPKPVPPPARGVSVAAAGAKVGTHSRSARTDWERIAEWIATHRGTPAYSTEKLAQAFGVPVSTAKNWPGECRRRGLLADEKFTNEPITKMPVNEQAARNAAAEAAA